MTTPFEPLGSKARWRTIYDLLQAAEIGAVVKYVDIAAALDLDADTDRHTIQMAARRAAKEHLTVDNRAIEPVQNVGYRIVEPEEHLRLAQQHQNKSRKALAMGHKQVVHVDLNGMEPEVRKAFDVTARAFSTLLDYNRRLDTKQKHLEKALDSVATRQDKSDDEIRELKERLARLEQKKAG